MSLEATKPSQVTLKTAFTVCFAVVASAALVMFLLNTRFALTLMLGAAILAVSLDHAVSFLSRKGLSRGLAIGLVALVIAGLLTGFSLLLIPPAISQGKALVVEAPQLLSRLRQTHLFSVLDDRFGIQGKIQEQLGNVGHVVEGAASPVLAALGGALSGVATAVTLFFLVIFMLIFGGERVEALLSESHPANRERYQRVLAKIYGAIGGYTGGVLLICGVNATLTTTFLAVTRMPFFLPLGILSGISSLVPYAGPIVSGGLITVLALVTGGVWKAVATAIYFVLYGQLEGNILGPVIFKRTVHLNPLITLLSILFIAELLGVVGAVVAVPAVAAAQIVLTELLSIRRERMQA